MTERSRAQGTLRRLRSDVNLSGIFVRDYLLDASPSVGPEYRSQLSQLRAQTGDSLSRLDGLVDGEERTCVHGLGVKIDDYWEVFDPLFGWTPAEKSARSLTFLRREVLPRRDEVLRIARDIESLNDASTQDGQAQVALRERELRGNLNRIIWWSLGLGALVALGAVARIRRLEWQFQEQHQRTETANGEMRRLSRRLVSAQEDEEQVFVLCDESGRDQLHELGLGNLGIEGPVEIFQLLDLDDLALLETPAEESVGPAMQLVLDQEFEEFEVRQGCGFGLGKAYGEGLGHAGQA